MEKLRINRRDFLCLAGGAITLVATSCATGGRSDLIQERNTESERNPDLAEENLAKTLEWMESSEVPKIVQSAEKLSVFKAEYDRGDKTRLAFVGSGTILEKVPAGVTTIQTNQGRKLIIVLSLKKFGSNEFSKNDAAISLFEALYIYERAETDPKRYERDLEFQETLKQEAAYIASQVFSKR